MGTRITDTRTNIGTGTGRIFIQQIGVRGNYYPYHTYPVDIPNYIEFLKKNIKFHYEYFSMSFPTHNANVLYLVLLS